MRFTLIDTLLANFLIDRPSYGCAMLMGALKEAHIPATFLEGQPIFLEKMFCEDAPEIYQLLQMLDPTADTLKEKELLQTCQEMSEVDFIDLSAGLYEGVFGEKGPREYLNLLKILTLERIMDLSEAWQTALYALCDGQHAIQDILQALSDQVEKADILAFFKQHYKKFWVFQEPWID